MTQWDRTPRRGPWGAPAQCTGTRACTGRFGTPDCHADRRVARRFARRRARASDWPRSTMWHASRSMTWFSCAASGVAIRSGSWRSIRI